MEEEKKVLMEIVEFLGKAQGEDIGCAAAALMQFLETTDLPNKDNVIDACEWTIIDFSDTDTLWLELNRMLKKLKML